MSSNKINLTLDEFDKTDFDDLLKWAEAHIQEQKLRREHRYVADLINVLRPYKEKGLSRKMALHFMWKNRERLGLPMPRTFDAVVQHTCEYFCVDSEVFNTRNAPDEEGLFCWPHGWGKGHWAIRPEQAGAWLKSRIASMHNQAT